jgi:putative chitinase
MSVAALQSQVGVEPDGDFGPKTLKAAAKHFNLTNAQAAHFFGQCHHESGGFKRFVENLNYSADGLMRIWPKRFQTMSVARAYAGDAEAIANRAYADRMGNGPATSGDGWKYRGRGAIQLTGRSAYAAFSESDPKYHLALDMPDLVATDYAFDSAHWFFGKSGLWIAAKTMTDGTIENITRKINGGTHGLADRIKQTKRFYAWLT